MEIILHRINKLNLLRSKSRKYGIEIDIRSFGKNLILNHDPFLDGELLKEWLKSYEHGTLILNVKEDGLEEEILFYLKEFSIESYFFLDQPFPTIYKSLKNININSAIRVSDYESIENLFKLNCQINWIWLDIFDEFLISKEAFNDLKNKNFKICLASPELNNTSQLSIKSLKKIITDKEMIIDAVCTKYPQLWET